MMPSKGQRFVFTAHIIGAVHRETPKLKMFMISVLWSDETEVIVYRSYDDFKKFHKRLKKKFSLLNPNNNKMIPKFKGEAHKSNLQQRGSELSAQRMKALETYCNKLLVSDPMVTQSAEVTQFFTSQGQDLDPDLTKNSLIILLSEDGAREGGGGEGGGGTVISPLVTQTYRSVAAYETKDTKNRPFKVAMDEKVEVLMKDPAGWWLVENEEKCMAWFPGPYLEKEEDETGFQLGGVLYCAVRSYSTNKADEVSVPIGSVVEVLRMSDDGWWLIRFNGKVGYVPSMYLKPNNSPRTGLDSLQRKMHGSTLNLSYPGAPLSPSSSSPTSSSSTKRQSSEEQPRVQPSRHGRLSKSQSMEILSETWTHTARPAQAEVKADAACLDNRVRSISSSSEESSLCSSCSSISSRSSRFRDDSSVHHPKNQQRRSSSASYESSVSSGSCGSFTSFSSSSSDTAGPIAPLIPPRPKKEEILNRCSTETRKAAMDPRAGPQMRREPHNETRL
ncbi:NADPH oxidase organizer 1-like [Dunckerocampus dactyliophorus]|uniref:NADPH oxidase organizer 1-like n=1 Tax=Dunckerocampus dactyliophorus TaxID=161453 RepID=UPI002405AFB2|nr:NADPH oxidase organizer 1-like [Dunckerocampus dactyliophorus]